MTTENNKINDLSKLGQHITIKDKRPRSTNKLNPVTSSTTQLTRVEVQQKIDSTIKKLQMEISWCIHFKRLGDSPRIKLAEAKIGDLTEQRNALFEQRNQFQQFGRRNFNKKPFNKSK